MKRLYDKSNIIFSIILIVIYCVTLSIGDSVSSLIGIEKIISLFIALLFSLIIIIFIYKYKLKEEYGLCNIKVSYKKVLYFIPLIILMSTNLWYGVTMNLSIHETIIYILTMLCVGFLEEIIFRGFLFNAMKKDNLKVAIIVSSITFGIGHIINLINGSGADLINNLLQVVYATSAGFMFVMIYYKTNSLIPCIITHGVFNALSVFSKEVASIEMNVLSCLIITLITGLYALYLLFSIKRNKIEEE